MECDTITVLQAYEELGKLILQGKGNLPLIALHNNGDTSTVSISDSVSEVSWDESMGVLCD